VVDLVEKFDWNLMRNEDGLIKIGCWQVLSKASKMRFHNKKLQSWEMIGRRNIEKGLVA